MNSILIFITSILFLFCTALVCLYLYKVSDTHKRNKDAKIQSSQYYKHLKLVDNIIQSNVASINRSMVNPLKAGNNFLQLDREEAFLECKNNIYNNLSPLLLKKMSKSIVEVDEFISARIEYHVKKQKIV